MQLTKIFNDEFAEVTRELSHFNSKPSEVRFELKPLVNNVIEKIVIDVVPPAWADEIRPKDIETWSILWDQKISGIHFTDANLYPAINALIAAAGEEYQQNQ